MKKKVEEPKSEDGYADLLNNLAGRLNQLLLWETAWGIIGIARTNKARVLETRLKKLAGSKSIPVTSTAEENYEFSASFFIELHRLLMGFVAEEKLGTEYDKRRAGELAGSILALGRTLPSAGEGSSR